MPLEDKPVHARNVPTPTDRLRPQVPREDIAARAEKLWRERNCPAGSDDAIWLEAESQLKGEAESRPVPGTEAQSTKNTTVPVRKNTKSRDPADAAAQVPVKSAPRPSPSSKRLRNQ